MSSLMNEKNSHPVNILIFFGIICMFLFATPVFAMTESKTIQTPPISDVSTPITLKLTISKIPHVYEETILHVEINCIFDANRTNVKIILPSDVESVGGLIEKNIDIKANTPQSFETKIKFLRPGNFKIIALAHKVINQENSWGDEKVLYLTIGDNISKITDTNTIILAGQAQSASEQSLKNTGIDRSSLYLNIKSPIVILPLESLVDKDEKPVDLSGIYSPQNNSNNAVQGTGTITVTGTWSYYTKVTGGKLADFRDNDNALVPLMHAYVGIYDNSTSSWLRSGYTDDNGNFSIDIVNPYPHPFYVYVFSVMSYTDTQGIERELRVVSTGTSTTGPSGLWTVGTSPFETVNGSYIQNIGNWYPPSGSDHGHAFMLFQDLIRAHNFIGEDVGSSTILWNPKSNDGDYYVQGGQIHLKGETYKSADDSIHEFGHNYMWSMNGGWTNTCPSTHYIYLGDDTQCAYKEGWADFLPLAVNENPIYHWADGSSLNIETLTLGPPDWDNGDTCEGRVAGAFWDIYDNVNDGYDEFQFPYSSIDTTVRQNTGFTFFDFWNTWTSSGYSSDAVWSIFQNTIDYNRPLSANFSADSISGKAPLTVQFVDISTGSPTRWNWSFGDRSYSTKQNPLHVYENPGIYTVSLNITNSSGYSNNKTKINYINVTNTTSKIGVYQNGAWYLDYLGEGTWTVNTKAYGFGAPGFTPVIGDWNKDGKTKIGVYKDGAWYLDYLGDGSWTTNTKAYGFGAPGFTPVIGDWNGDNRTKIGVYKDGAWYLDYLGNGTWTANTKVYSFGAPGFTPVVGDWNGDGRTKIGVFKDGAWYLDYLGEGTWTANTKAYGFGATGFTPVIGDWNGDGRDKIGVYKDGAWYLDYLGEGGWTSNTEAYSFGATGFTPIIGKWT